MWWDRWSGWRLQLVGALALLVAGASHMLYSVYVPAGMGTLYGEGNMELMGAVGLLPYHAVPALAVLLARPGFLMPLVVVWTVFIAILGLVVFIGGIAMGIGAMFTAGIAGGLTTVVAVSAQFAGYVLGVVGALVATETAGRRSRAALGVRT
jgi:hypothetical protein